LRILQQKDIIIVITVIAVALIPTFIRKSQAFSNVVLVEVDGKVVMRIENPGRYDVYRNGKRITTVIFNGKEVRVENSTCRLKICEKMGWVKPGGEIICVPNHLIIRFEKSKTDAMTW